MLDYPLHQTTPVPNGIAARPHDLTTYENFAAFMQDTGRAPTVRSVQRWVVDDDLQTWPDPTDPRRRRQLASVSDLLEAHRRRQTG